MALRPQPVSHEMEVEVIHKDASLSKFIQIIGTVLQGKQRSYVLVRNSLANEVLLQIQRLTKARPDEFPGPQPSTLEIVNILTEKEPGVPNLRYDDYNVTDKADGQRCLLTVMPDGRIFLIDTNFRVYGSGLSIVSSGAGGPTNLAGCLLDG